MDEHYHRLFLLILSRLLPTKRVKTSFYHEVYHEIIFATLRAPEMANRISQRKGFRYQSVSNSKNFENMCQQPGTKYIIKVIFFVGERGEKTMVLSLKLLDSSQE